MFGDQTPSNTVWWRNMLKLKWDAKRLQHVWTYTDQTIVEVKWEAKRLKHVWTYTDQTMDTSRWARVVKKANIRQVWYSAVQRNKIIAHRIREQEKCFKFLVECLMAFKFYRTRPNTIKQRQTRQPASRGLQGHICVLVQIGQTITCLVTKICLMISGHQTFLVCSGFYRGWVSLDN